VILASTIGFIRNEDFFIKVQAVALSNFYGITFLLLGESVRNFDLKVFLMALMAIIINIVSTFVVIHSISRSAFAEKVKSNAVNRRDLEK